MAFVIEYYKNGKLIGSTPWAASLEKTVKVATDGLIRHEAEYARIVDDDGNEAAMVNSRA
jgi:hypothetical protein